jgi:HTH-type transcriptional regulator/antitoxin HipB
MKKTKTSVRQYHQQSPFRHSFNLEHFEALEPGVMIQELRREKGMTQEQLAEKCGTTKTYISRIENNASDIRLSTLMRIIREGFGVNLKLSVDTKA